VWRAAIGRFPAFLFARPAAGNKEGATVGPGAAVGSVKNKSGGAVRGRILAASARTPFGGRLTIGGATAKSHVVLLKASTRLYWLCWPWPCCWLLAGCCLLALVWDCVAMRCDGCACRRRSPRWPSTDSLLDRARSWPSRPRWLHPEARCRSSRCSCSATMQDVRCQAPRSAPGKPSQFARPPSLRPDASLSPARHLRATPYAAPPSAKYNARGLVLEFPPQATCCGALGLRRCHSIDRGADGQSWQTPVTWLATCTSHRR
jgi:hypothetical protein